MSVPRSLDVTTFQDGIVRSSSFSLPVSMMRMVMMLMMMMMVTMVTMMVMMVMMVMMMMRMLAILHIPEVAIPHLERGPLQGEVHTG